MGQHMDKFLNTFSAIATLLQTNKLYQDIQFWLTIVSIILSLAFTIYKWYSAAKRDKKITLDEIEELKDIVDNHIEKIDNTINKGKKEE